MFEGCLNVLINKIVEESLSTLGELDEFRSAACDLVKEQHIFFNFSAIHRIFMGLDQSFQVTTMRHNLTCSCRLQSAGLSVIAEW